MQFVVTATDFKDSDALNRRVKTREEHLSGIKIMVNEGTFKSGGVILDSNGKMVGSSIHVEFKSREDLQNWLDNDPYTLNKVWEHLEVKEKKLVAYNPSP
ncbi:MAG: hypothetical protein HRT90_01755 [Candidatus Margulisbacteria bacterium]|nr:hypothetical protein [Candidatus Margulisiibacteriota bacterium]